MARASVQAGHSRMVSNSVQSRCDREAKPDSRLVVMAKHAEDGVRMLVAVSAPAVTLLELVCWLGRRTTQICPEAIAIEPSPVQK